MYPYLVYICRDSITAPQACFTSLRDAGFAALCGCAGMWLLLCPRVWLCEDL